VSENDKNILFFSLFGYFGKTNNVKKLNTPLSAAPIARFTARSSFIPLLPSSESSKASQAQRAAAMATPDAEQPAPTEPARWRDLDMLLSRPGNLVAASFDPSPTLRDLLGSLVEVLVVGAGGLGCELLKDLALSGFKKLHVIDMDTIDVSNLNRQFLFRVQDVGKSKAEVAAKRVMERVSGVNIEPHFCRIEDKEIEFYSQFHIIVLGLDSIEARSYINSVACGFLEYDSNDNPLEETVKPMVDGGTEGFKGHARVIIPGTTPCFECNIWLFPPQVKFPLCTLAETPRTAAHCIEYAHLIKWDEIHPGKPFDADDAEHMQWIYSEALKRAELFGISGVTYSLTQVCFLSIDQALPMI